MTPPSRRLPALEPRLGIFGDEPRFAATAVLMVPLALVTLMLAIADPRQLDGAGVWWKPLKFAVALGIYLGTLAFYARWLPEGFAASRRYRAFSWLVVTCAVLELVWIYAAAFMGVRSHFNVDVPFLRAIYGLMGVLAVTLTTSSLVYGVAIWRDRQSSLDPAMRLGLAAGLVLTFALTVAVAGAMAAGPGALVPPGSHGSGSFLFGWSRGGGDLRVAHFVATHALHVVPLVALLASRSRIPLRVARGAVVAAACLLTLAVALLFAQAKLGKPFLPGIL